MFLRQHFYHQHIRKAIIAFGTIFNQISVKRYNSDQEVVQSVRVPLAYSPKNKFLARIAEVPSTTTQAAAIILPRMGFEITGLQYNPARKITSESMIKINFAKAIFCHRWFRTCSFSFHCHRRQGDFYVQIVKFP